MNTTISPVFFKDMETEGYLDSLKTRMKASLGDDSEYLLGYPALYIHVWRSKKDYQEGKYSIYIGETNDIIQRTNEHWAVARNPKSKGEKGAWQYHMVEDVDESNKKVVPMVFFIGHKFFHKSHTLDIENRLTDYCYAMPTANVYNGRPNPQGRYAGEEYLDDLFSKIWRRLRKEIPDLFLPET
ncbi:MAG: hypothetical protein K6G24_02765 [Lachnospiraceae bacterium]|nr:hypothetical protein [Lachnospiraceae bacterium]